MLLLKICRKCVEDHLCEFSWSSDQRSRPQLNLNFRKIQITCLKSNYLKNHRTFIYMLLLKICSKQAEELLLEISRSSDQR